ncbi:MAG: prepilin-type N-terminal cleavage/methylation domain-containing protein [Lachnospiraceae bacterium]|nr:prepilin-type N-terminal cleavage/methylation domain-containing protein [Lachnospiraceae bacterium]
MLWNHNDIGIGGDAVKKNNKGFTLLELMIAVIILALIIAPMLRGFVSSHRVNGRSRHLMRATTLAQNEMEIFEKEKLEDLLDDTKFSYDVDDTTIATASDGSEHTVYTFTRSGVINDESGRDMFDVVVTLNPSVSSAGSYDAQNTEEILFMNTVSGMDSATYIQRVRNRVNENGEDEEVYKLYETRQHPEGITGTRWTADDFAQHLKRTITLKIEQEDQGGFMTTVAKVRYDYESGFAEVPDEYKKYTTKDKVFFNNAQTLDEEGNPIELKSVYLFYAPRYKTSNVDEIIVENKDKLPVNVYIIRQNILDSDTDETIGEGNDFLADDGTPAQPVPFGYRASIKICEGLDADGKTYGRYFTNLNLDLPGVVGSGAPVDLILEDCDTGWSYTDRTTIMNYTGLRSLGSTESKDRIYTMETAVYEHGDDPLTDEPVVRLTGTKIE